MHEEEEEEERRFTVGSDGKLYCVLRECCQNRRSLEMLLLPCYLYTMDRFRSKAAISETSKCTIFSS